jgi:hypothetical protein
VTRSVTAWGELGSSARHLYLTDGLGVRTLTFDRLHAMCQSRLNGISLWHNNVRILFVSSLCPDGGTAQGRA